MMTQLLVHLPDDLVRRFKRNVAPRQRSRFVQRLLEEALAPLGAGDDDPLYQAALAVEQDDTLNAQMAEWEETTLSDGLSESAPEKKMPK